MKELRYLKHGGEWWLVLNEEDSRSGGWYIKVRNVRTPEIEGYLYHENPFNRQDWLEVYTDKPMVA